MAFTPEDGTGLADANALASLEDVSAYLQDRGGSAWLGLTEAQQEAAIVIATDYISNSFVFLGEPLEVDQALGVPTDEIAYPLPAAILGAVARVAFAVGVGNVDLYGVVSADKLLKSVKAGAVQVDFADSAAMLAGSGRPDFPWLVQMLAGYVEDVGGSVSRKVMRT